MSGLAGGGSLVKAGGWALAGACAVLLTLTLVSLLPGNWWFVRLIDLIREPAMYLSLVLAVAALLVGRWRGWLVGGFVVIAALQLMRIWPYVALAPTTLNMSQVEGADCFTVLSLNVKMRNEQYGRVADMIAREQPDVLLLMEPDESWARALAPSLAAYDFRLSKPLDNAYGMIFASNLPVRAARMVTNTSADTPTLYASLDAGRGEPFDFIGLHPRPPVPGQDTRKRDANIARAGAKTLDGHADAVVMGDFNDVPWSRTTTAFRARGGWRDPRIGRGSFPTFPAGYIYAGWPLDQLMVKGLLKIASFDRLQNVGADHLPMFARVCR